MHFAWYKSWWYLREYSLVTAALTKVRKKNTQHLKVAWLLCESDAVNVLHNTHVALANASKESFADVLFGGFSILDALQECLSSGRYQPQARGCWL
jgi:hypothetical protein